MLWITLTAALAAYLLGTAQGILVVMYWRRWEQAREEEAPSLASLGRQVRLLQGRLNSIAPPRTGTGKDPNGSEIVEPGASQGAPPGPMTRAELYRQLQARRMNAGR